MNYEAMSKGGKRAYCALAVFLFLLTTAAVFIVNHYVAVTDGEKWYETVLSGSEKVGNVLDILKAQKWYFFNAGGRNVAGALLQLTLMCGELAANIINTCVFVLLAIVITALSQTMTRLKRYFPEKIMCTTAVMALMLGLSADWKGVFFEQSGVCNYLMTSIFVLLFIWVYMREIPYDCFGSKAPLAGVGLWIIPLAFLAGCSTENIGPVVFVFSIVATVYVKKVGHMVQPWMKTGVFFSFVGSVLCTITPGNYHKMLDLADANTSVLKAVYVQFFDLFKASFDYLLIPVLLLIISFAISKGILGIETGIEVRYILNMALFSWLIMLLAPVYPGRMSTGTMIFMIIAILAIWQKIFEKKGYLRKYAYLGTLFMWLRGMYIAATFVLYFVGMAI